MTRRLASALPLMEPIVPVLYPQPLDGPEWLFEPKYDGFRGLFYLSGRRCEFRSKAGKRAAPVRAPLPLGPRRAGHSGRDPGR